MGRRRPCAGATVPYAGADRRPAPGDGVRSTTLRGHFAGGPLAIVLATALMAFQDALVKLMSEGLPLWRERAEGVWETPRHKPGSPADAD